MLSGELGQDLYGRIILGYQDQEGMHKDNTFGGDTGTKNENIRFSLFGEGTNHEWSFTADNAKSKIMLQYLKLLFVKEIQLLVLLHKKPYSTTSLAATTSGLDIFVTDFSKTAAYVGAFVAGGAWQQMQQLHKLMRLQ